MADENKKLTSNDITVRGNLSQEPKEVDLGDGKRAFNLTVATNETYKDADGNWQQKGDPEFININITNQPQVEMISKAIEEKEFGKGSQFSVEGHINKRTYEKDGEKRYITQVSPRAGKTAIKVEFDEKDFRSINQARMSGFVSNDPEIKTTKDANGNEVKFFTATIASDYSYKDKDNGEWKTKKTFMDVSSFNPKHVEIAEKAIESGELAKGAVLSVMGRMKQRSWDKEDGSKGYAHNLSLRGGEDEFVIKQPSKEFREKAAAAKNKSSGNDEIPF